MGIIESFDTAVRSDPEGFGQVNQGEAEVKKARVRSSKDADYNHATQKRFFLSVEDIFNGRYTYFNQRLKAAFNEPETAELIMRIYDQVSLRDHVKSD